MNIFGQILAIFGFFSKNLGENVPFLSGKALGHTSVLPDCSITRHEHFLSNIGDFWLFLKFFLKNVQFLSGNTPFYPTFTMTDKVSPGPNIIIHIILLEQGEAHSARDPYIPCKSDLKII